MRLLGTLLILAAAALVVLFVVLPLLEPGRRRAARGGHRRRATAAASADAGPRDRSADGRDARRRTRSTPRNEAGLDWTVLCNHDQSQPEGIIDQEPPAGTAVAPGSPFSLYSARVSDCQ